MERWEEREWAIMNGIMSLLDNECDAVACLRKQGGTALYEGVASKIRPTLQVCAAEAAQRDRDLEAARQHIETMRFALESVAANAHSLPASTKEALSRALPGHPFLGA